MSFEPLPASAGLKCNRNPGLEDGDSTVCGAPAVLRVVDEDYADEEDDEESWWLFCAECRLQLMRDTSTRDQQDAYEAQHGYPPGVDLVDLAFSLGAAIRRFESFLDTNAPVAFLERVTSLIHSRADRILRWLLAHPPPEGISQVGRVNAVMGAYAEAQKKGEELNPTEFGEGTEVLVYVEGLKVGLLEARRLAAGVDMGVSARDGARDGAHGTDDKSQ